MWKPPKNPVIEELTKSCRDRSIVLSGLEAPTREDGKKGCLWCCDPLKSKHPATRYCKDEACSDQIWAWANPQSNNGLFYLLHRQNWKCNGCQYDYREFMINEVNGKHYGTKNFDFETKFHWPMKALKMAIPPALKPEVDHVIPIYKGGTALGLDNHQVICYTCHKVKSKVDNAGPRGPRRNDKPKCTTCKKRNQINHYHLCKPCREEETKQWWKESEERKAAASAERQALEDRLMAAKRAKKDLP